MRLRSGVGELVEHLGQVRIAEVGGARRIHLECVDQSAAERTLGTLQLGERLLVALPRMLQHAGQGPPAHMRMRLVGQQRKQEQVRVHARGALHHRRGRRRKVLEHVLWVCAQLLHRVRRRSAAQRVARLRRRHAGGDAVWRATPPPRRLAAGGHVPGAFHRSLASRRAATNMSSGSYLCVGGGVAHTRRD